MLFCRGGLPGLLPRSVVRQVPFSRVFCPPLPLAVGLFARLPRWYAQKASKLKHAKKRLNIRYYNRLLHELARERKCFQCMEELQRLKRVANVTPDAFTYTCVLDACARSGSMELVPSLIREMIGNGMFPTSVTYTTVIGGYAKKGLLGEAFRAFRDMQQRYRVPGTEYHREGVNPNTRTYNALLRGCLQHGDRGETEGILKQMLATTPLISSEDFALSPHISVLLEGSQFASDDAELDDDALSMVADPSCPNQTTLELLVRIWSQHSAHDRAWDLAKTLRSQGRYLRPSALLAVVKASEAAGDIAVANDCAAMIRRLLSESGPDRLSGAEEVDWKLVCDRLTSCASSPTTTDLIGTDLAMSKDDRVVMTADDDRRPFDLVASEEEKHEQDERPLVAVDKATRTTDRNDLRLGQQFDWKRLFGNDDDIHLEIGCGKGDWVCRQVEEKEHRNWVALDRRYDNIGAAWWRRRCFGLENRLVLVCGEADRTLRTRFSNESVDYVHVRFPTAPPSERIPSSERKLYANHLITRDLLSQVHRVLKINGHVECVIDDLDYCKSIVREFEFLATRHNSFVPALSVREVKTERDRIIAADDKRQRRQRLNREMKAVKNDDPIALEPVRWITQRDTKADLDDDRSCTYVIRFRKKEKKSGPRPSMKPKAGVDSAEIVGGGGGGSGDTDGKGVLTIRR